MNAGTGVFVLRDEATLVAMQAASFATEDDFQRLLASFPELLAGDQIDAAAPRRFLLIAREQGIPAEEGAGDRWSLDHLFLDQDGVPTLVEVKRGTDTRIRREVIGQMLDYAANSVLHWPVEAIRAQLSSRCQAEKRDPESALAELIGQDSDPEGFWAQVRTNLQAGRVRLLFVADRIPPELRRVVEFLNRQMDPAEVLAIELRQYEGQGLRTLVPIVLGQTQDAAQKKGGGASGPKQSRAWDEASIMSEIAARSSSAVVEAASAIASWTRARSDRVAFNANPSWGSMGAVFRKEAAEITALRLHSDASVVVYFEYMLGKPVFDALPRRQALLDRLNAVPGIRLPPDAVSKRKTIPLAPFTPASTAAFLAVMDWFVDELRHPKPDASAEPEA
ncbi:hypothetical protein [Enterovirga sp. CN4-39]|uniref:hypothetical protein n=1 Tax=Enterovirga sp. CN4-39 TaxID=3400910 RepID=UPI003C054021